MIHTVHIFILICVEIVFYYQSAPTFNAPGMHSFKYSALSLSCNVLNTAKWKLYLIELNERITQQRAPLYSQVFLWWDD